jgi:hypothetical protein
MEDFKFKHGKMKEGLWAAGITSALLIAAPLILILILENQMRFSAELTSELASLMVLVIVLGIPAGAMAFFRGFYRKGSLGRMVFGLAEIEAVLLYMTVVLLFSNLPTIFDLSAFHPDQASIFLALLFMVAAIAIGYLFELFWFRDEWRKSIGLPISERPPLKKSFALDFSLRIGASPLAQKELKSQLWMLIIIPALILTLLPSVLPHFLGISTSIQELLDILQGITTTILLLGILLFPIAWFRGFYPKGSFGRLVASLAFVTFLVLYIYMFLIGHGLDQWVHDQGIHFDYALMVLLVMVVPLFQVAEAVGEVIDERKPWKSRLGFAVKIRPLKTDSILLDFNPRTGKIGDGAQSAKKAYIGWLVIPFFLLSVLAGTLDDVSGITNNIALAEAIGNISSAIAPFALIIIALSFVWGFYPRGSFGRLTFGLLKVPFILLLVNAVFMDGALEQALWNSDLKITLGPIIELFLIYAALVALLPICELIDYRREWKFKVGRKLKPLSAPKKGLLTDFRLRYTRFVEGAKMARRTFRSYIITPVIFILVIRAVLTSMNEPILNQALHGFQDLDSTVLSIGVVLVIAQFCRGSYRAGSFSRLCFGFIVTGFIVLWTYTFFSGMTRINTLISVPDTPIQFDLAPYLQWFLIIMLIWAALKGVRYLIEYVRHRNHWLESRESWVVYGNTP